MSNDPLADVIAAAIAKGAYRSDLKPSEYAAEAVRAHLAAVLDAEEAKVAGDAETYYGLQSLGWRDAIDSIRTALGVAPTDREGG